MDDSSSHFLMGVPTEETSDHLKKISAAAPLVVFTAPVCFLSPPSDRDDFKFDFSEGVEFEFQVVSIGFPFNPSTNRTEFCIFLKPVVDSLLTDAGVDSFHFRPYATMALDPMRTKTIRFWCKNFGDSLVGTNLKLHMMVSTHPQLLEHFNPTMEKDHPFSFSDGL